MNAHEPENQSPRSEAPERVPSRPFRRAVQILAILISLALLAWFVSLLLSPESRRALDTIAHAPSRLIALLAALSLASLILNGLTFYCTLRPLRPAHALSIWRIMTVQAIATMLSSFPFKLSLVARFLIHNRRDGIPVLTIGAWLAANSVVILAALAPPLGAALWRRAVDLPFLVTSIIGLVAMYGLILASARLFAGEAGLRRLAAIAQRSRLALATRLIASPAFARLHTGFAMLASPLWLGLALGTRILDLAVIASRFVVAGHAAEVHMPWESSILAGASFFLIGVLSPAGSMGAREGGTTGLAALATIPGVSPEAFAAVTLAVSAVEMVVVLVCAAIAILAVAPWRLRADAPTPPSQANG